MNRARLVHLLIGKSILETCLVGGIAVVFYFQTFPPYFHGWGEATPTAIAGWAVDNSAPWDRVRVQLYIDGQFVANDIAMQSRPDVVAAGWARDEWHGYAFEVKHLDVGLHEARVFALHESGGGRRQTLQLLGDPIKFEVHADGSLRGLSPPNHVIEKSEQ